VRFYTPSLGETGSTPWGHCSHSVALLLSWLRRGVAVCLSFTAFCQDRGCFAGCCAAHPNEACFFAEQRWHCCCTIAGTGKTTVARLYAKLLEELKVLPQVRLLNHARSALHQDYSCQTSFAAAMMRWTVSRVLYPL